ncbi:hypothetical protein BDV96DRAFT_647947 [Lophiotrema nucula]|uniref:Uncharacterized protein n=1 Tax=Lophiotrema nucula TaxID=690887 RepID=A0A6A5Z478_9PLEO|nr:hypothetical protein BDV96DRAFT_647947 [Lophiotrema nucula]
MDPTARNRVIEWILLQATHVPAIFTKIKLTFTEKLSEACKRVDDRSNDEISTTARLCILEEVIKVGEAGKPINDTLEGARAEKYRLEVELWKKISRPKLDEDQVNLINGHRWVVANMKLLRRPEGVEKWDITTLQKENATMQETFEFTRKWYGDAVELMEKLANLQRAMRMIAFNNLSREMQKTLDPPCGRSVGLTDLKNQGNAEPT